MALTLVTDLTDEPVSLDEVKAHLRLDIDDDDAYVAGCIAAARQWVEEQTKRALMPKTYDQTVDYIWPWKYGNYRIDLEVAPVSAVTSIKYIDTTGAEQTLASSQYIVAGRTHHPFITPAYDVDWPEVRWIPDTITVRYTAGDADAVPQAVHRALMILAGHFYEDREGGDIPDAVYALISPYRRSGA